MSRGASYRLLVVALAICCCAQWLVEDAHACGWLSRLFSRCRSTCSSRAQYRVEGRGLATEYYEPVSEEEAREALSAIEAQLIENEAGDITSVALPADAEESILRYLRALPQLENLRMRRMQLTDYGVFQLSCLRSLTILDMEGVNLVDDDLSQLAQLEHLEYLNLEGTQITDAAVEHLKQLPKLQFVFAEETGFTAVGTKQLKETFPKLVIRTSPLDAERAATALESLGAKITRNDQDDVTSVNLAERPITDVHLMYLPFFEKLESLDLRHTRVTDDGVEHLLPLKNLKSLRISGTQIGGPGQGRLLTGLRQLKNLDVVASRNHSLRRDEGFVPPRRATTPYKQSKLVIGESLSAIASGWTEDNIEAVYLIRSEMAYRDWLVLSFQRELKFLYIRESNLRESDLRIFRDRIPLGELHLIATGISDEGLGHLSGSRNLRVLNLTGNDVTDRGLQHLSELNELRELYLTQTDVTDEGLIYLSRLTGLQRLGLFDTKVTDEGIAKLQQALPDCRISPPVTGRSAAK